MVVTEIERQVLDRPVISPVGALNEIWQLINKMYTGFSVQKFGENHVGQNTAKDCPVMESMLVGLWLRIVQSWKFCRLDLAEDCTFIEIM